MEYSSSVLQTSESLAPSLSMYSLQIKNLFLSQSSLLSETSILWNGPHSLTCTHHVHTHAHTHINTPRLVFCLHCTLCTFDRNYRSIISYTSYFLISSHLFAPYTLASQGEATPLIAPICTTHTPITALRFNSCIHPHFRVEQYISSHPLCHIASQLQIYLNRTYLLIPDYTTHRSCLYHTHTSTRTTMRLLYTSNI